jgi:hypothetical protein
VRESVAPGAAVETANRATFSEEERKEVKKVRRKKNRKRKKKYYLPVVREKNMTTATQLVVRGG